MDLVSRVREREKNKKKKKKPQAFEMRCYQKLMNISYKDHVTNEKIRRKIQAAIVKPLSLVKKRKIRWFGLASRSSGLAKTIIQGTVKGKRRRDKQRRDRKRILKSGQELPAQLGQLKTGQSRKRFVAKSSVVSRLMKYNRIEVHILLLAS